MLSSNAGLIFGKVKTLFKQNGVTFLHLPVEISVCLPLVLYSTCAQAAHPKLLLNHILRSSIDWVGR